MSNVRLRRDVSSAETCGFVTYILSFPIAAAYLIWLCIPDEILDADAVPYRPSKDYAVLVPTFVLSLFVSVPLLYAGINVLHSPRCDSVETLWDGHSKKPFMGYSHSGSSDSVVPGELPTADATTMNVAQDVSTVPEICDFDVGVINRALLREGRSKGEHY